MKRTLITQSDIEADRRGWIWQHRIGDAARHRFRAKAMLSIFEAWRRTNPFDLYGVEPNQ